MKLKYCAVPECPNEIPLYFMAHVCEDHPEDVRLEHDTPVPKNEADPDSKRKIRKYLQG